MLHSPQTIEAAAAVNAGRCMYTSSRPVSKATLAI